MTGILMLGVCLFMQADLQAQDTSHRPGRVFMGTSLSDTLSADTAKVLELAPLDIASTRGLFILTPDRMMQLRILGSVRYLAVFDNVDLADKNNFQTIEIPTGNARIKVPNYFNGLDQTRLGFEVTRRAKGGDVFVRLETDFAGSKGFRIRHAYGQYRQLLFGQTWSLFSHLNALPATVDFAGPTGSVASRTPQIRYTFPRKLLNGHKLSVSLEYVVPNLNIPDSIAVKTLQLVPDAAVRIEKSTPWGSYQLSGIIPILSASTADNKLIIEPGWGLSASLVLNSWQQGKWYFMAVGGKGITRFVNNLEGNGLDVILKPSGGQVLPFSYGGYVTYEHTWNRRLYSSVAISRAATQQYDFTEDDFFRSGSSVRINTFWDIVEGAKIGGEWIFGRRKDHNWFDGNAMRFNLLVYYDF